MSRVVQRAVVENMPAYVQGKSLPDAIKLSSNENPYPPLGSVLAAAQDTLASFNLYPDMSALAVRERIAAYHGVRVEEVSVGAGSTEVAQQLINASVGEGEEVMFPWRSFEAYPILALVSGATPVPVPLTADERHDFAAMVAAITERTRVIFVCTPNNPTGTVVHRDELEEFLAQVPETVLVVIDEAYVQFDNDPDSADGLDFFRRYPNIAVLHTFSKAYGMAGLRIGYAIAEERIIMNLRRVSLPFGVSALAQTAAIASLDADAELLERVESIVVERDRVFTALREKGWELVRPRGNFVWLRTGDRTAEIDETLRGHGVVARAFAGEGVRVTIGNAEMNDRFLRAISGVVPNA